MSFSNFIDPSSSSVFVRSASRVFSAFRNRLAALGEHIGAFQQTETTDLSETSKRNTLFQIEQLINQTTFSQAEIDRMKQLIDSRIVEQSNLPEREKTETDPSKLEGKTKQQIDISLEDFNSKIKIAREYMDLKARKAVPSTLGFQSRSRMYRLSRYCKPITKVEPTRQGLKRCISKMDVGCYDNARRVRQKLSFKDFNLPAHIGNSSKKDSSFARLSVLSSATRVCSSGGGSSSTSAFFQT